MNLPKATPAPKPNKPLLLVVPYLYATFLVVLVVWQLVIGPLKANAPFTVTESPFWVVIFAAAEVFALPFLLRLSLSPLARSASAFLSLVVPYGLIIGFLNDLYGQVGHGFNSYIEAIGTYFFVGALVVIVLSVASAVILWQPAKPKR